MNKIIKPLVVLVVVLVALALTKNMIAKAATERICRKITGLELRIGAFDLSFLRSSVTIKNLRLFNPSEFPDRVMFDVSEVYCRIKRASITSGAPHLEEVRLHLKELLIEKNKEGKLNVMALKPEAKKKQEEGKPVDAEDTKPPQITIDLLNLRVDKVIYKDYTGGGEPRVQEFNVNLNETYRGITNINALVPLIVQKAIMNTTISSLANLNISSLVSNFSSVGVNMGSLGVEQLTALTGDLTKTGQSLVSGVSNSLSADGVEGVGQVANEATKAVSGLFGALADSTK